MSFANNLIPGASRLNNLFNTDSINNSFDPDHDFNYYDGNTTSCLYYDDESLVNNLKQGNSSFSVMHINARSLWKNSDDVSHLISNSLDSSLSIVAITETWIHSNTPVDILRVPNYTFIHADRTHKRGGGVGFYVNDHIDFKERSDLGNQSNTFESLFIETLNLKRNFVIGVIYRPPDRPLGIFTEDMLALLDTLNRSNKPTVLLGDFNIDLVRYHSNNNVGAFMDAMFSNSFIPLITKPTRITDSTSTLIDNIFCNDISLFTMSGILVSDVSDHFPIFSFVRTRWDYSQNYDKDYIVKRNMSENSFNSFIEKLNNYHWDHFYSISDVNEACNTFIDVINKLYDEMCPLKKVKIKKCNTHNPWITSGILKSITTKKKLYKRFVNDRTLFNKLKFTSYKNKLTNVIRYSKKSYYTKLFDENRHNIKETWKLLNEITGRKKDTRVKQFKINNNDDEITNDLDVAECFNNYFSSIGNTLARHIPRVDTSFFNFLSTPVPDSMYVSPTNCYEVSCILNKLKKGSSPGTDGISVKILQAASSNLVPPLTYICNLSLSSGVVPLHMKQARVTPVFKAGDPSVLSNYRPISILPSISKVLERIMYDRLLSFLNKNDILSSNQFGFRKNLSTYMAVTNIVKYITHGFNNKEISIGISVKSI